VRDVVQTPNAEAQQILRIKNRVLRQRNPRLGTHGVLHTVIVYGKVLVNAVSSGGWGDATGKLALPLCIIFAVFEVEKEIPNKEVCCPQSAKR
jgi:hypothetical protein